MWLLKLYILMLKKEEAFVIIEAPEAYLYPGLQYKVIEFRDLLHILPFGKYSELFELLKKGETRKIR